MQQNLYAVAIVALLSVASLSQAAPAGIKGQAQEQLPAQPQAIKGPRQQVQAIKGPAAPVRVVPVAPQPIIAQRPLGPGAVSPVFSSKRPIQPAPVAAPLPAPVIIQQQQQQAPEPEITQQQQQQIEQASEIDPTGAAQGSDPAILAPANSGAAAPISEEEANPKPEPYAFNYAFEAADSVSSGSSAREEQQDASGRVTGFYTLKGQDGRDRRVDYVADAAGFRATISTNEMGTAQKEPADVRLSAQGPTDGQLRAAESATELARQRALLAPAPQQQQQQERLPAASSFSSSKLSPSRAQAAANQSPSQSRQEAESAEQAAIVQLQEPFEQIRQTELNSRARKSRHAPFYLFTI